MKSPTFVDFFKSFYYSNTYLPPVELNEQGIKEDLLASIDNEAALKAQKLISQADIRKIFSEPWIYDWEKNEVKQKVLDREGFKLLSRLGLGYKEDDFYKTFEHPQLNGWVFKPVARFPKDELVEGTSNDRNEVAFLTEEDNILRIEMAKRVAKVAKEANIEVVVPQKKLVAYANLDGAESLSSKYVVLCEKIDILSIDDTTQAIQNMAADDQQELAEKISTIIQKAGLAIASFNNIRLTKGGKIAFIDTRPMGLIAAKKTDLWGKFFACQRPSIQKCARLGLERFIHTAPFELLNFREQLESDYKKISKPRFSKWKIALSIASFGIIPLINAVEALVKARSTKEAIKNWT